MTPRRDGPGDVVTRDAKPNGVARNGHVPVDLIAAFADQELDLDSALEVERHVGECAECQRSLRLQRAVRDRLVQETAAEVPIVLRDRVFAAVRAAPRPATVSTRTRTGGPWRPTAMFAGFARHPGWAVAAVLVVAVLAYSWNPTRVNPSPTLAASDSAAILGLIQSHATAWNERDASAVAELLTADAVWVTSTGVELRGREAIEQAHLDWLALDSAAGGTRHVHPPGTIRVRLISADVAVADAEGQFIPSAVTGEPSDNVERARIFIVATREGGTWRISQLRNLRRQGAGPSPR